MWKRRKRALGVVGNATREECVPSVTVELGWDHFTTCGTFWREQRGRGSLWWSFCFIFVPSLFPHFRPSHSLQVIHAGHITVYTHTRPRLQPACLVCFHVCACVTSCISKHKQVFFFLDASLKTSQNERLCWHCWESWDARLLTVLENRVRRFAGAGGGEGVCW
jgi:hypothetical protein